jgi:HPt (histidine-containing phosphotransfer) domain-containing protein
LRFLSCDAGLKLHSFEKSDFLSGGAERDAHSLKGSAATLGADVLAEEAAKMEAAIKSGHNIDRALFSLSQSLEEVLAGIRAVLPE